MVNVNFEPVLAEISATSRKEFDEQVRELYEKGFVEADVVEFRTGIYRQNFVKKKEPAKLKFKYLTDYLFEVNLSGKFNVDAVNKLYDRW